MTTHVKERHRLLILCIERLARRLADKNSKRFITRVFYDTLAVLT